MPNLNKNKQNFKKKLLTSTHKTEEGKHKINRACRAFLNFSVLVFLLTCETSSVAAQVLSQFNVCIEPSTDRCPRSVLAPPISSRMHRMVTCVNFREKRKGAKERQNLFFTNFVCFFITKFTLFTTLHRRDHFPTFSSPMPSKKRSPHWKWCCNFSWSPCCVESKLCSSREAQQAAAGGQLACCASLPEHSFSRSVTLTDPSCPTDHRQHSRHSSRNDGGGKPGPQLSYF